MRWVHLFWLIIVSTPIQQLNEYLVSFKQMSNNVVICITYLDTKTENSTAIYRNWAVQQSATYPLFFIDAHVKHDVLLLLEALIATAEIQITH